MPRVYQRKSFWDDVDKNGPLHPIHGQCWQWTGCIGTRGYGQCYDGRGNSPCRSHRMAWRLTHGSLDPSIRVLHKCDNPLCVNPDHLFLGTDHDNMVDKVQKNRHNPPVGERHGMSKVTEDIAVMIRSLYRDYKITQPELAEIVGVSQQQISKIVRNQRWRHV